MSQSVQTQASLLTAFSDGQPAGSITPQDVRNLIVSAGYLAGNTQAANITPLTPNVSGNVTLSFATNGSVQSVVMGSGYTQLTVTVNPTGLGANIRLGMELYVTQNSAGNGTILFYNNTGYANVYGVYLPTLGPANYVTRFLLVSIDGGSSWSIVS